MKKILLVFSLWLGFGSLLSASLVNVERSPLEVSQIKLQNADGSSFIYDKSPLGDKDVITYQTIQGESGDTEDLILGSFYLPYNKSNLRTVHDYITATNSGTISDGPYLWMVYSLDAFFQDRYLYVGTTNFCSMQSYMLDVKKNKRRKYPNLTKIGYNEKYFIGDENYGCDDGITITVSNLKNLFDIKRANFDAVYNSGYDVASFAMSGDTTLIINFDRFSWLTDDAPKTLQRSLDLSTIDRKNKKQQYFYQE